MKAMVLTGKNTLALRDVPDPALTDDSAIVQVEACAICNATDLRVIEADDPATVWPNKPWPVILGHEVCGTIVSAGEKVSGWRVGDRVAGMFPTCAGFAEYTAVVPARSIVYRVPPSMPSDAAAVLELVTGTLSYCMPDGKMQLPGKHRHVFIAGLGPAGLFYVQECKLLGFETIYASDRHEQRRELATKFGATKVLHPDENPFAALGPSSIDVAIDTTGKDLLREFLSVLRPGGVIVPFGVGFNWKARVEELKAKDITLTRGHGDRARAAKSLIESWLASGSLDIASLITSRISLAGIPEALRRIQERAEIKVVVEIN